MCKGTELVLVKRAQGVQPLRSKATAKGEFQVLWLKLLQCPKEIYLLQFVKSERLLSKRTKYLIQFVEHVNNFLVLLESKTSVGGKFVVSCQGEPYRKMRKREVIEQKQYL